jgi:hypothetical protein
MSKLFANEAKLESKSFDKIFWSTFSAVVLLFAVVALELFETVLELVGCKTSPNASNSKFNMKLLF